MLFYRQFAIADESIRPQVNHFNLQSVIAGLDGPGGFLYPRTTGFTSAHANALAIDCDPSRVLESVELRATCSEAVIGLAGMTALAPKAVSP